MVPLSRLQHHVATELGGSGIRAAVGRQGLEVVEHSHLTATPLAQRRRDVGAIKSPGHVAGQAAGEPFAGDHLNFIPKRQLQQRQDPVPVLVMTRQGLGFQQGIGGALAHQEAGLAVVLQGRVHRGAARLPDRPLGFD